MARQVAVLQLAQVGVLQLGQVVMLQLGLQLATTQPCLGAGPPPPEPPIG